MQLIIHPDGPNEPGVTFDCATGYVLRCVSAISDQNIPDARWACEVLNRFGHLVRHAADREAAPLALAAE